MHEMSIAENMLEVIEKNLRENGYTRCSLVRMRIGLLAAVDEDALRFAFEALTGGTPHEGAALEVEMTCPRARCACGESFEVTDMLYLCPACGSPRAELEGGDELDIVQLEVD